MSDPAHGSASLPNLPVSLVRAAAPWKRAATATTSLPEWIVALPGWRPERGKLAAYRTLVGSSAEVPIAFPQIPVMAMHMDLISRWSYPIRAMGMIHSGSVVDVRGPLDPDATWDLRVWGSSGRNVRAGMEFDLWGEVSVEGSVRWVSRAVYLSRSKAARGAAESTVPEAPEAGTWSDERVLPAPGGTGRAFARATGDANPIHLHDLTARLFGFRRAIAHGWWTTARIAAMLGADECVPGRTLEIIFRRPVELPSTPLLRSRSSDSGAVEFSLIRQPGGRADEGRDERPLAAGRILG